MTKSVSIADARQNLSNLVDDVTSTHERVVLTRHGEPTAVVMAIDDLAGLQETLDIVSDHRLLSDIKKSLTTVRTYSIDEVKSSLRNYHQK